MLRRVQILNYRCLRYVDVRLDRFRLLVGANASGKTTFMDALDFVGDLVSDGLEEAVMKRTRNFQDLVWDRPMGRADLGFELALEFAIPEKLQEQLSRGKRFGCFRYEVKIGIGGESRQLAILRERGTLKPAVTPETQERPQLFPAPPEPPDTVLMPRVRDGSEKAVLSKTVSGNDIFYAEIASRIYPFRFKAQESTLGHIINDENKFPVATWVRKTLKNNVQRLILNSVNMRKASAPDLGVVQFATDGSNLPWAVQRLQKQNEVDYKEWLAHLRYALPDLEDIRVVERPEDRHAYLMLRYKTGLEVPSWMASDGTLRLLALTLLAYLPNARGLYLLEEPENGIHPQAIAPMHQSLSSVYGAQVLVATHSPVLLHLAKQKEILCFSKNKEGATDIVRGEDHPFLREWQGEMDLEMLFASGLLG